jgi:hypothetical protein
MGRVRGSDPQPAFQLASDVDGTRFLLLDDTDVDAAWCVQTRSSDQTVSTNPFQRMTVWGSGSATNLLGYGEPRETWGAVVDHGCSLLAMVTRDGRRLSG